MRQAGADPGELTVGQLSERSGVAVSALHFYERQHLIASRRTSGNQRRYRRDALRRVALIRVAQRVGIPLAEVRAALAELPDNRTPNRADWARLSQRWHDELQERIRNLEQLRDDFTNCIGCGCLSLDKCRMTNPQDSLAEHGPGPRRRARPGTPGYRPGPLSPPGRPGPDPPGPRRRR
jgi:MerR family redox-sensitive transcriptional activator SoxR